VEILTVDGERIFNNKSAQFAGYAYYFLKQLQKDFPDKRVKFYSNRYDYSDWFDRYYDFDQFPYHHAQYPWARWDNVGAYYIPQLLQFIKDVFSGSAKPNLPPSRDDYVLWQVGANTGLGYELGFGADYLDINVSSMSLEDFREWSGIYNRWNPDTDPKPEVTRSEMVKRLMGKYIASRSQRIRALWEANPHLHTDKDLTDWVKLNQMWADNPDLHN